MLKLVLLAIFLSIIFIASSLNPVHAATTTISDKTSCEGIGGVWTTTPDTCTLSTSYTVNTGDELIINSGITLTFAVGEKLINHGSITNNGFLILIGDGLIQSGSIRNLDSSTFTNSGTITITGGSGDVSGAIAVYDNSSFTNTGTIILIGKDGKLSGFLSLRNSGIVSNSGSITITGGSGLGSGVIDNWHSATILNSGTITITGGAGLNSGYIANMGTSVIKNNGIISMTGGDGKNSGLIINTQKAKFENFDTIEITAGGPLSNSRIFTKDHSEILNRGTITSDKNFENGASITNFRTLTVGNDLSNLGIFKNCGTVSITGDLIGNRFSKCFSSSTSYTDPTIGITKYGLQVVDNGICINITCWTVTSTYHQDFELVEMLSDSINTISVTVYCQKGVAKCNYVAFGVSPYGTNINDSVWKVILEKDHQDKWTMTVIDPDGYLGDVTSTTQIVNDGKHLGASMTALFKKPTPGMILNVETRDSDGGYSVNQFNDGITIKDVYAYPTVDTSYEPPLEKESLCLNENPNKRYTCAFDKVREWTIKNAEAKLDQIINN